MKKEFIFKLIILVTSFFTISLSASDSEKKVIRAAFDLGSGDFKLYVAEVSNGEAKTLFKKIITVGLGADSNENNGKLSEAVQKRAFIALNELCADAKKYGAESFSGIATEVFRKAENGPSLFESLKTRCHVPLQIISQNDEGRLGFLTGAAIFSDLAKEELLILDIGSLSTQISGCKESECYGVKLGNSKMAQIFAQQVRNQTFSKEVIYDDITFDEIMQLSTLAMEQMPEKPDWFLARKKSGHPNLCFFDYTVMIDTIEQVAFKRDHLTLSDFEGLLKKIIDPNFKLVNVTEKARQERTFSLILLYSLMKKLEFQEVNLGANDVGNSPGLTLAEEFWF